MGVDYSPITFSDVEPTDGRSSLGERELLWLVGISFVAMWRRFFLSMGRRLWFFSTAITPLIAM